MIEIKPVTAQQIIETVPDLMRMHQLETEKELTSEPPAPNAASYRALEEAGCCACFGAFDGEHMVGYITMFVIPHQHYAIKYGHHDTLFVHPKLRGSIGLRLRNAAKQAAKDKDAKFIIWHAKPGSKFEELMQREGHPVEDVLYKEEL